MDLENIDQSRKKTTIAILISIILIESFLIYLYLNAISPKLKPILRQESSDIISPQAEILKNHSNQKLEPFVNFFQSELFKFSFRYPASGRIFSLEEFAGAEGSSALGVSIGDNALTVFIARIDSDLEQYANAIASANKKIDMLVKTKVGEANAYTFTITGSVFTTCINGGPNGHEVCGSYGGLNSDPGEKKIAVIDGGIIKLIFIYPKNISPFEEVFKTVSVANFEVFSFENIVWKNFDENEFGIRFEYPDVYNLTLISNPKYPNNVSKEFSLIDSKSKNFLPLPWVVIDILPIAGYSVGGSVFGVSWTYNSNTQTWDKHETTSRAGEYLFPKEIISAQGYKGYYFNISYEGGAHNIIILPFKDKLIQLDFKIPPALFDQSLVEKLESSVFDHVLLK